MYEKNLINLIYVLTVFPQIVPSLEQFPPLNSFRGNYSIYEVKNCHNAETIWKFPHFPHFPLTKNNSFRGNYLWKYGTWNFIRWWNRIQFHTCFEFLSVRRSYRFSNLTSTIFDTTTNTRCTYMENSYKFSNIYEYPKAFQLAKFPPTTRLQTGLALGI